MSLRDTLEAARREAQEADSIFAGGSGDKAKDAQEEERGGFSRKSAARARPTSAAASSVRVVSVEDAKRGKSGKKTSEMTKEERKAERAARRDVEDRKSMAANILLKRDPVSQRGQKLWWVLLGIGLVMTLISFGINLYMQNSSATEFPILITVTAMASIVLAYVCIIGAFIYDFVKVRPVRRRIDDEVNGMSKRRIEQLIAEDVAELERKKAEKDAKKNAKKALRR